MANEFEPIQYSLYGAPYTSYGGYLAIKRRLFEPQGYRLSKESIATGGIAALTALFGITVNLTLSRIRAILSVR
jgi:hypothetical protein